MHDDGDAWDSGGGKRARNRRGEMMNIYGEVDAKSMAWGALVDRERENRERCEAMEERGLQQGRERGRE